MFVIRSNTHTHTVSSHLSLKRKIKISPAEHYFPFTSRVKYNRNNASISRQTFPFLRENGEAGTYYTTRPVPSYVFFLAWASRSPKDATISRASMRETLGRSVTQADSIQVSEKLPRKSDPINDLRLPRRVSKSTCISSKTAARRNKSL